MLFKDCVADVCRNGEIEARCGRRAWLFFQMTVDVLLKGNSSWCGRSRYWQSKFSFDSVAWVRVYCNEWTPVIDRRDSGCVSWFASVPHAHRKEAPLLAPTSLVYLRIIIAGSDLLVQAEATDDGVK